MATKLTKEDKLRLQGLAECELCGSEEEIEDIELWEIDGKSKCICEDCKMELATKRIKFDDVWNLGGIEAMRLLWRDSELEEIFRREYNNTIEIDGSQNFLEISYVIDEYGVDDVLEEIGIYKGGYCYEEG